MKTFLHTLFITVLVFNIQAQEIRKTIKELPDTGQTLGYTNTPGEDADYSINVPSYTVINGGIVLDNVTGLQWQKADAGEMTHEQAIIYADTCTLGGFTDWRLPSPLEAYSITILSKNKPPLDLSAFATSTAEYWWTNLPQYNDATKVWVTNAGGGIGNHLKKETISAGGTKKIHTRVVRDAITPEVLVQAYVRTDYGSIIDKRTNLEWFPTPSPDSITWEQALQFAEQSTAGSHDDWRMPNIKELFSLASQSHSSPSIDPIFGIKTINTMYWSSTTLSNQTDKAWYMDSRYGITTYALKTQRLKVIPVRNANMTSAIKEESTPVNIFIHGSMISIQASRPFQSVRIHDILGNCIHEEIIASSECNWQAESPGFYVLIIHDGERMSSYPILISP